MLEILRARCNDGRCSYECFVRGLKVDACSASEGADCRPLCSCAVKMGFAGTCWAPVYNHGFVAFRILVNLQVWCSTAWYQNVAVELRVDLSTHEWMNARGSAIVILTLTFHTAGLPQ